MQNEGRQNSRPQTAEMRREKVNWLLFSVGLLAGTIALLDIFLWRQGRGLMLNFFLFMIIDFTIAPALLNRQALFRGLSIIAIIVIIGIVFFTAPPQFLCSSC